MSKLIYGLGGQRSRANGKPMRRPRLSHFRPRGAFGETRAPIPMPPERAPAATPPGIARKIIGALLGFMGRRSRGNR